MAALPDPEWVIWETDPGCLLLTDGRRVTVARGDQLFIEYVDQGGRVAAAVTGHRKRTVH